MTDIIYMRGLAAQIINEVTKGRSLTDVLNNALKQIQEPRDRAFVQALCYGVCRLYSRLEGILNYLLSKPLKARDGDIHALLLVGLYQLIEMRVPPHAAVAETVAATKIFNKPWAHGLVNALLREYLRQQKQIEVQLKANDETLYSHPLWWINKIRIDWPDHWQQILSANNMHPPLVLRVNQRLISRAAYLEKLYAQQIVAEIITHTQNGIMLATPMAVEELPGFLDGQLCVQDGAAQLAGELLDLQPKQRVLDACAAPGGKLTHILEMGHDLDVLAIDNNADRIEMIKENLHRLKLQAQCICADAASPAHWWDGRQFDRILLDAPCSASGVIRRHPDIKLLRKVGDIALLAESQLKMLNELWPLLKPGGLFLYATCSIFKEENSAVLKQFFISNPNAKEEKIAAEWGLPCEFGRQILPGMHQMDGFYYGCMRK